MAWPRNLRAFLCCIAGILAAVSSTGPAWAATGAPASAAAASTPANGSSPGKTVPVALLLCLDRSGSMGGPAIAAMQRALRESLVPGGQGKLPFSVAIMSFGTRTQPLLGLTDDASRVAAAISRLRVDTERDGKTRLRDAVAGALAQLRGSDAGAKHLIVVSDGDDEGSDISRSDLIRRASASSIPIDAVGFGALAASRAGSLATLAGATGGTFHVANNDAELRATLARLVRGALGTGVAATPPPASSEPSSKTPPAGASAPAPVPVPVPVPASGAAPGPASTSVGSSATGAITRFFSGIPAIAWAGIGLLLLGLILLTAILLRRRRVAVVVAPAPERAWEQHHDPTSTRVPPPRAAPASPNDHGARAPDRRTRVSSAWPSPDGERLVATLKVTAGSATGRRFEMRGTRLRIGCDADNEVVLDGDDFVSAHHALLKAEADSLYLVDLGALNGTELNGVRFKGGTRVLSSGDRITLGRTTLEVQGDDHGR